MRVLKRSTLLKKKAAFCLRNEEQLKKINRVIRSTKYSAGWWRTQEMQDLIKKARKQVGYSPKTIDLDIINGLYRQYKCGS